MASLSSTSGLSDDEAVVIDRDDVSNYNPEHILPQSPNVIKKIRQWLQPTSYDLDSGEYRKHLASHTAGTGTWLTSSTKYQEWLNGEEYGTLWAKGIPGSGKSVLAAKLADELARSHAGQPVLYFFFRQIIDANHSPVGLLRDWLDQILIFSPPLQKRLEEYVEKRRAIDSMSMDELWKDLRMAFANLSGKVYCIADALDEMDQGNDAFLEALAELGQFMPKKVKLFMTSRPVPRVETPLRTAKCIQMRLEENVVDIDIATYVRTSLEATVISREDQDRIKTAVPGRANGLFLYAKLAMDAFLEPNARVEEVLKVLPMDLNDMYTNLLHEHSRRSGVPHEIQLLILQWVTHATRPLRILELAEIINVTHWKAKNRDLKEAKDLVRSACGPLLELLPDETVCVVHHSFTEYLKGSTRCEKEDAYPILHPGATHARLAIACLTYMKAGALDGFTTEDRDAVDHDHDDYGLYDPFDDGNHSRWQHSRLNRAEWRLKYPFGSYATANWSIHVGRSEAAAYDQLEINEELASFFGTRKWRMALLMLEWQRKARLTELEDVTEMHIAARNGLTSYLATVLKSEEVNVDAPACRGKTAIWWAADRGHAEAIRTLIEAGANPDVDESHSGLKPLHQAASKNHSEAIATLLKAGVSPLTEKTRENPGRMCGNAPRSTGHTPLMYVCNYGHLEGLSAFLPFLQDVEVAHRALAWSARGGHSRLVEKILEHPGVNVNAKVRGDTPLFLACQKGDANTIRRLLSSGADPTILSTCIGDEFGGVGSYRARSNPEKTGRGYSPLHGLCCGPRGLPKFRNESEDLREIVSLLLDSGADVNQRTGDGSTALHMAFGEPLLIRLLLDGGADANAPRNDGIVPLHLANSMESIVNLIENGHADIEKKRERDGKTPLLCLLENYDMEETLLKFLEYGPNQNATDKDGNGALHIMLRGYKKSAAVIKKLLEGGVNPNQKNHEGFPPLHVLRLDFHPQEHSRELLDMLLAFGANINGKDVKGATLLFKTADSHNATHGSLNPLKSLLDLGATLKERDYQGRTLLHHAVASPDCTFARAHSRYTLDSPPSYIDFLLELGLDINVVDYRGNNLFHELALQRGNSDSYRGPKRVSCWKRLLTLGMDLNQVNNAGETPLHILCSRQNESSSASTGVTFPLEFVISSVKDIDAADNEGMTALHHAALTSDHYVRELLKAGANPASLTFGGLNALHFAARSKRSNAMGMLLGALSRRSQLTSSDGSAKGVDASFSGSVDAEDSYGWTPLCYACQSGVPETVSLLLHAGANAKGRKVWEACCGFEVWEFGGLDSESSTTAISARLNPKNMANLYNQTNMITRQTQNKGNARTRLEEIFEMLLKHGASVGDLDLDHGDDNQYMYYGQTDDLFEKACKDAHDYTATCLARIKWGNRDLSKVVENTSAKLRYYLLSLHLKEEASRQALRESKIAKPGENESFFLERILLCRQFFLVEELFHLGLDFLFKSHECDSSCFEILIQYGYAGLLDKIGTMEAEKKFREGTWYAAKDKTKPGFGHRIKPSSENEDPARSSSNTDPTPFLLQALRRELPNMEVVKLLVEKFHVDLDEVLYADEYMQRGPKRVPKYTALIELAQGNHWWQAAQAIPYLISQRADTEITNFRGQTALHIALGGGEHRGFYHEEAVEALIAGGANVNAVDNEGKSCLAYAGNKVELVHLLIQNGAIVKPDGLFAAIGAKQPKIVEALLSYGADANMRRPRPVLDPEEEKKTRKTRRAGLHSRAGRTSIEAHEWYPIQYAATLTRVSGEAEDQETESEAAVTDIMRCLLAHGADPFATFRVPGWKDARAKLKDGYDLGETQELEATSSQDLEAECTVIHEALIEGDFLEPLLSWSMLDPNRRDQQGCNLFLAACSGRCGPDSELNVTSNNQWYKKGSGGESIFDRLRYLGADLAACDAKGRNALHLMLRTPHFTKTMKQVLEIHPELINQRDYKGQTPLHIEFRELVNLEDRDPATAQMLIDAGADLFSVADDGTTLLHLLARQEEEDDLLKFLKLLTAKGLDVNARNLRGETPLFVLFSRPESKPAVHEQWFDEDVVTVLVEAGADLKTKDNKGRGLCHAAAGWQTSIDKSAPLSSKRDCDESVHVGYQGFSWLLEHGLDPTMEDNERRTALDVAAACGNEAVLSMFEKDK